VAGKKVLVDAGSSATRRAARAARRRVPGGSRGPGG